MYATEPMFALDALDVYIALLCFAALLLIDFAIYTIRQKRKSSALKGQLGAPRGGGGDGGADF
jgi:hypothetical protein